MDQLAEFLAKNAYVVVGIFFLSLVANVLQVLGFIRDKKALILASSERSRLVKLVETYEFILEKASRHIRTDEDLRNAAESVKEQNELADQIKLRIEALEQQARKKLVEDSIIRLMGELKDKHLEVQELRKKNEALGPFPEIPERLRAAIDSDLRIVMEKPFELPKPLAFRALLLVLFIFLLPYPSDLIFTLVFLHLFLETFFEAANIQPEDRVAIWVKEHEPKIILLSIFGTWFVFINFVESLVTPLIIHFVESRILETLVAVFPLFLTGVFGFLHWRVYLLRHPRKQA